jgi:uncharacterized membrane protein YccC
LLFASVGEFQNHMVYDPVGLLNTSIAAVAAAAVALLLWSIIAPETPEAARARFQRAAHRTLARVGAARLGAFESVMADALVQWRPHLRPDRPDDHAALEAGVAVLGTGREIVGAGAMVLPEGGRKRPAARHSEGGVDDVA